MRRITCLPYLGALMLLASAPSACALPEYAEVESPATDPALYDFTAQPLRRVILVPARQDVIARWQLPSASPWLPYEKLTLPSVLADTPRSIDMPDIDDLDEVRLAGLAAARVAEEGIPDDAAWFVDLSGAASVAFGARLSHAAGVSVAAIPTFNNWPAEDELIPAEEALTAMILLPPRAPATDDAGARPVFLLDSWRLAYKNETIDEGTIDNRYMLGVADFPSAEVLRQRGIRQIIYVVGSDEITDEEDDLHELFASYEAAGIVICLVDLPSLAGSSAFGEASWYGGARARNLHVRPRVTVVDDPRFYRRARGGFGGAHFAPTPGGHVHMGLHGGG